jgi:hypothetical protein
VGNFFIRLQACIRRCFAANEITENFKVFYFTNGMLPKIQSFVIQTNPQTVLQALEVAQRREQALKAKLNLGPGTTVPNMTYTRGSQKPPSVQDEKTKKGFSQI